MPLPKPKYAAVDTTNPEAWAVCDRCGFYRNRTDLVYQYQWGGMQLYNTEALVCFDRCYDLPNEQLRTIILPPDPPPIVNARVPNFDYEENTPIQVNLGGSLTNKNQYLVPWGAGPQLNMCDQTGTTVLLYQYPNIVQVS